MYKAEVILASRNPHKQRLTTMRVTYPRIVHAEMCRHRMFSRNTASSRAIPFKKMLKAVEENPFVPLRFQKDHSGMQGTDYFEGGEELVAQEVWLKGKETACDVAIILSGAGVTKQLCNRILEPYSWITEIITGNQRAYENFFAQRVHEAADIHIKEIAEMMLWAYNEAEVHEIGEGGWHIPFGGNIPITEFPNSDESDLMTLNERHEAITRWRIKIATARCAQTSYTVVGEDEKPMDFPKLVKLHDRLIESGHWSPFEHCAMAGFKNRKKAQTYVRAVRSNFSARGSWIQYRKMFPGEYRHDPRVKM